MIRSRVRPLLGTYVEIRLQGAAPVALQDACMTAAFEAIERVDRWMSVHRPDSDLSRLNRAAPGEWVTVHRHTIAVLSACQTLYKTSQGIFDISAGGPIIDPPPATAGDDESKVTLPFIIFGSRVQKTSSAIFDLGGIAKGYAVDQALTVIRRRMRGHKITGSVNAGGDLRVWGPRQSPLLIRGTAADSDWGRTLLIRNTAVATSAIRQPAQNSRFTAATHVRMPFRTPLSGNRTVTVFAARCLWADALTKIALMAPTALAARCLARHRARALIFQSDGEIDTVLAA